MRKNRWNSLKERLEIESPTGSPQPKPTKAILAKGEKALSFRFPESYKEWVLAFGPGRIGGYFNIFSYGYPNIGSGSLEAFVELIRTKAHESLVQAYRDENFIRRMMPFADTIGGDVIVWDPDDLRDAEKHEYGIYVLPDDSDNIVELALDFETFINNVCLGKGFAQAIGQSDWQVREQFVPFGRHKK